MADSPIRTMQRFKNFWSNVSKLAIQPSVPDDTQAAIIRGVEKAYGEEAKGREAE